MFGVIVCPRCSRVRGVDLSRKRVSCPGCGHSIDVTKAKIYFSTEDQAELIEAVGHMAREIAPRLDQQEVEPWTLETEKEETIPKRLDEQGLIMIIISLTEEGGGFTLEELMERVGIEDRYGVRAMISKLLSEGLIYEPEPGLYRAI